MHIRLAVTGDGRIVGFAIADPTRSNLWALFVRPDAEGRGIGRTLHGTLLDWMFAEGAEEVWLPTGPGTRAEGFYVRAGWDFAGTEQGEARYTMPRQRWRSVQ